jgi:hypothetical protein
MPDIECGVPNGRAVPDIEQAHREYNRHTRFTLGDIAPQSFIVNVIGTLLLFTRQSAGRRGRQSGDRGYRDATGDEKAASIEILEMSGRIFHVVDLAELDRRRQARFLRELQYLVKIRTHRAR